MSFNCAAGCAPAASVQMRMSSMIEVCCACRKSAERVSSAMRAIGPDIEALEEAEAEGVVARQPVHALLLEQQHAIEARAPPWRPWPCPCGP